MKRPYVASVWLYDGREGSWLRRDLRGFRSHERARRAVQRWLARHPVVTTSGCYHRDVARGDYGEVRDARRPELCGATIEAPVRVVPSVADRGVW